MENPRGQMKSPLNPLYKRIGDNLSPFVPAKAGYYPSALFFSTPLIIELKGDK